MRTTVYWTTIGGLRVADPDNDDAPYAKIEFRNEWSKMVRADKLRHLVEALVDFETEGDDANV